MSKHDLVELARAHGLHVADDGALWGHTRALTALARTLFQHQREKCAQVADAEASGEGAAQRIAAAIRLGA